MQRRGCSEFGMRLLRQASNGALSLWSFGNGDRLGKSLGSLVASRVGTNMGIAAGVKAVDLAWLCVCGFH